VGLEAATHATCNHVVQEELQERRSEGCNENAPDECLIPCLLEFLLDVRPPNHGREDGRAQRDDAADEWAAELDEREDVPDGLGETRLTEGRPYFLGQHRVDENEQGEQSCAQESSEAAPVSGLVGVRFACRWRGA